MIGCFWGALLSILCSLKKNRRDGFLQLDIYTSPAIMLLQLSLCGLGDS